MKKIISLTWVLNLISIYQLQCNAYTPISEEPKRKIFIQNETGSNSTMLITRAPHYFLNIQSPGGNLPKASRNSTFVDQADHDNYPN